MFINVLTDLIINKLIIRSIWDLCFNYLLAEYKNIFKKFLNKVISVSTTKNYKYQSNLIICIGMPTNKLIEFFSLWPAQQWISSLLGLVLLYVFTTWCYNKRLRRYDLQMTFAFQFWMICTDLILNLIIGLYYMQHRNTVLGALTVTCPISLSPAIFVIELIILIIIKEYQIKNEHRNRQ